MKEAFVRFMAWMTVVVLALMMGCMIVHNFHVMREYWDRVGWDFIIMTYAYNLLLAIAIVAMPFAVRWMMGKPTE